MGMLYVRVGRAPPMITYSTSMSMCVPEEGAFEASLREELGRRRLARARRIVPWAQVLVVSMACTFTANSGLIGGSGKRFGSTVQDIAIGITAVIVIIMWISQWMGVSVVTLRSLDYWYSAFMACLVAYMSPFAIRADLVAYRMNVSIWFVFLCLFNLKPWFNFIWLLMISSTFCCTLLFGDRAESMKVADYNSQSALADWLQNFCAVVLVLLFLNQLLTYIARLELDTKFSRNELAAATSVLTSVCEVVVDLDDKFRLQRHSRELTDMLFLNPQRRLCQEDIRSFLASESDRRKFSRQMGQMVLPDSPEDGPHPSNTFQVSMKDSTGNSVNVNVIAVCYTGRDGVHAFMVGIVEVCDSMPLPSLGSTLETRRQRQRRPRQDSAGPQAAPPAAPLGPPEEAEEAESSGSGSGSDPSALGLEQAEGEHLAVWINMASAGY
ncbi:unnamed protein product [Prorocentrum cordatum]|uniref:Uncharacterized protein n=1 Tax=Prorocentrum cordatum TaxID=2364126 RepID=A0ABN9RJG7_9DINO|nr:unnamed protein product [Polarella glacialis]